MCLSHPYRWILPEIGAEMNGADHDGNPRPFGYVHSLKLVVLNGRPHQHGNDGVKAEGLSDDGFGE